MRLLEGSLHLTQFLGRQGSFGHVCLPAEIVVWLVR